ncbi:citrate/2-methylcitrate synthase [Pontibacillus salicampi]|uniref:Citrate synthase n=1 Tax=Pontibacillus salicampi TaxID=1449801 RepID=A0ABV6LRP4_9BACI
MIHKGLKGVVCTETSISFIDGQQGTLLFRGYPIDYLTRHHSFEEVAHLLWYGHLPTADELTQITAKLRERRALPKHVKAIIEQLPAQLDVLSVLRTALSSCIAHNQEQPTIEDAITLTAMTPAIIAYQEALHQRKITPTLPEIRNDLTHVEHYLYMLTGSLPEPSQVKALETYMILTMEHGLNASTFSARVTASTEADMISAICSALGTMKGPLHGGAPTGVLTLLDEAAAVDNARDYIYQKVQKGERLMGFGHRVYKVMDPRAEALKEQLQQNNKDNSWLHFAMDLEALAIEVLEEVKPGRSLYTNVEFYAAAIMRELGLASHLFTPTFSASRMVGWTAHVIEQRADNVIFRPRAEYIGPLYEV